MKQQDEEIYLTFAEAAERMEVSSFTVRRRIISAGCPVFRDGRDQRRQVIRLSDLEAAFRPRQLMEAA